MKKVYQITFILGIIGIIILTSVAIINYNLKFSLNGQNSYTIEVGNDYEDPGYTLKLFNHDITKKVVFENSVNTNKVGVYYVNYKMKFLGKNYILNRKITVLDTEEPLIKLNGDDNISLYKGNEYNELGATAIDNYDGDITKKIVIEGNVDTTIVGEYILKYKVTDSSGNENSVFRKIIVKENELPKQNNTYTNNDPISKYINNNNYKVSIGYYNLVTGKTYYYQENKIYYGASLIKTLDAIYLYDNNLVTDELKLYIKKAISVSDNSAHQYLINYIGKEQLKKYGIKLGAVNTLSGSDNYGNTTVLDQIIYWKKLYNIIQTNEELKSYFINNYGNYMQVDEIINMHKYGYYGSNYHDVGIFFDKEPYILVILTEHGGSNEKDVINNISKFIYQYHKNN